MPGEADRPAPPAWLFGVANLPFGLYFGIIVTALPYLLRLRGIPPEQSSVVISLAGIPACVYGLWAPLVDILLPRRAWLMLASAVGGILAGFALRLALAATPDIAQIAAVAVAGGCAIVLVSTANAGLIAGLLPTEMHTRTAGWLEAGNLGGGAVGAAAALWLAQRHPRFIVWLAPVAIILPSLAAMAFHEPRSHKTAGDRGTSAARPGLLSVLRSPRLRFGLIVAIGPVGAAAASNLFSAIAPDYHTPDWAVIWVTGFSSGLLATAACIATGYVISKFNPVIAYLTSGAAIAALSAVIFFSPLSPATYIAGNTAYVLLGGSIDAAFSAMALHLTAKDPRTAGTGYSLLAGASNLSVTYMTLIDGQGARWMRGRGVFGVDALVTAAAALAMLLLWRRVFRDRL